MSKAKNAIIFKDTSETVLVEVIEQLEGQRRKFKAYLGGLLQIAILAITEIVKHYYSRTDEDIKELRRLKYE